MATITKKELVSQVADAAAKQLNTSLSHVQVQELVQIMIDEIADNLANGDTVVMRNFGSFEVRESKAKIGRNPKNPKKDIPIPARFTVKFKPGKQLKERVLAIGKKTAKKKK